MLVDTDDKQMLAQGVNFLNRRNIVPAICSRCGRRRTLAQTADTRELERGGPTVVDSSAANIPLFTRNANRNEINVGTAEVIRSRGENQNQSPVDARGSTYWTRYVPWTLRRTLSFWTALPRWFFEYILFPREVDLLLLLPQTMLQMPLLLLVFGMVLLQLTGFVLALLGGTLAAGVIWLATLALQAGGWLVAIIGEHFGYFLSELVTAASNAFFGASKEQPIPSTTVASSAVPAASSSSNGWSDYLLSSAFASDAATAFSWSAAIMLPPLIYEVMLAYRNQFMAYNVLAKCRPAAASGTTRNIENRCDEDPGVDQIVVHDTGAISERRKRKLLFLVVGGLHLPGVAECLRHPAAIFKPTE
ncbi:unnamed protein product [Amoebophrya sp. A25]|nr:unnamed protein product [Amoebophrya sp. A25]|eukprot:GSA25T00000955001.1